MTDSRAIGQQGVRLVQGKLTAMGWNTAEPDIDDGIDLVSQYRKGDELEFLPFINIQVKTGTSYFRESRDYPGNYLFQFSKKHYDLWTTTSSPTLVMLVDLDRELIFWAEINRRTASVAGQSFTVLIPFENIVNEKSNSSLLDVCRKQISHIRNHGIETIDQDFVRPAHLARYALINPWIFPTSADITKPDYSAPALAIRSFELHPRDNLVDSLEDIPLQRPPAPEYLLKSDHWPWRAAGAISSYISRNDGQPILDLAASNLSQGDITATACLQAAVLLDQRNPANAEHILRTVLEGHEVDVRNELWLTTQLARAQYHQGNFTESNQAIADGFRLYDSILSSDLTCDYLIGICHEIRSRLHNFFEIDTKSIYMALDNTIAWRAEKQTRATLSRINDGQFKDWLQRDSFTHSLGSHKTTDELLVAAAFRANVSADESRWQSSSNDLLADTWRRSMDRPPFMIDAMRTFGTIGNSKRAEECAKSLVHDYQVDYQLLDFDDLHPSKSTHLSARSDLLVLRQLAEVMPTRTASQLITWTLATMLESQNYRELVFCQFHLLATLHDLLRALFAAHPDAISTDELTSFLEQALVADQSVAVEIAGSLSCLPQQKVDEIPTEVLSGFTQRDSSESHETTETLIANKDEKALELFLETAASGHLEKLSKVKDLSILSCYNMDTAFQTVVEECNELLGKLDQGCIVGLAWSPFALLVRMNLAFKDKSIWEPVIALFERKHPTADYIAPVLEALNSEPDPSSVPIPERLLHAIHNLHLRRFSRSSFGFFDVSGPLAEFSYKYRAEPIDSLLDSLLQGDTSSLLSAVKIMSSTNERNYTTTLLALTKIDNPIVHACSTAGLVTLRISQVGETEVDQKAVRICSALARRASHEVLKSIRQLPTSATKTAVCEALRESPYSSIRAIANILLKEPVP